MTRTGNHHAVEKYRHCGRICFNPKHLLRNKKWEKFLHDRKSMGLLSQKIKTRGKHGFSKRTEVRIAAELGMVGRSTEPESRDAGGHIWP